MKIAVLSGKDPTRTGGAEQLINDVAAACYGKMVYYPSDGLVTNSVKFRLEEDLDYDFFIAMDDISAWYLTSHKVPHLYYLTTPRRALYDMSSFQGLSVTAISPVVRLIDRNLISSIKNLACISHTVRNRIYKFYGRESFVLYPPVHLDEFHYDHSGDFWLSVNRVDKWKRIELQIETFRKMPDKTLLIAGPIYPEYRTLVEEVPSNIIFSGELPQETLVSLYSSCKGLLVTSIDEDFGYTPLEAMASGKPVVAVREGGYTETIVDFETGRLVGPTTNELIDAINFIEETGPETYRNLCMLRAGQFSFGKFKKELNALIDVCAMT